MLTLYCRADEQKVRRILAAGLHAPAHHHETLQDFQAVWLYHKAPADAEGHKPYLVSVKLDCTLDALLEYDGSPADKPHTEWLLPVAFIHTHGRVQVSRRRPAAASRAPR